MNRSMLESIEIDKEIKPIPKGLLIPNLKKLNLIIGENGVGKTKLFKYIQEKYCKCEEYNIIFIPANEVSLTDFAKNTDSSNLVKSLADLIKEVDINGEEISKYIKMANKDIGKFCQISLDIDESGKLKKQWYVRTILSSLEVSEDQTTKFKIKDLAQGHQKLVILSLLKCFGTSNDKENVLLIEEPETFLHPKLKGKVNDYLKDLAKIGFQVFVSTHDPFFIFSNYNNQNRDGVSIISLEKDGGESKLSEDDKIASIVDELLHIVIYAQMEQANKLGELESFNRKYWNSDDTNHNDKEYSLPKYIRNQIHHKENPSTKGLVNHENECNPNKDNFYTMEELEESIKMMREELNKPS